MEACRTIRVFVASGLLCAFLLALSFVAAPKLHERFHADASLPNHECAVTLIATGKYEQSAAPIVLLAPQPAVQFEKIHVLSPTWVAASFLRAAIFEHAPPLFA
ncbi:MAG: hypothetical protein H0X34_12890 [Chthoniobacterales bacterium]|nr:hypothetical protein [Chthoniobacterales bacterium]